MTFAARLSLLLLAAPLLAFGCAGPDETTDMFGRTVGGGGDDGPAVDLGPDGNGDDGEGTGGGDEPDDDDGNDGDPPPDDDDDEGWDAMPPDAPDGTVLLGIVRCGFFLGDMLRSWEKDGDKWLEFRWPDAQPVEAIPGFDECTGRDGPKFLEWDEEPSIYFEAAGMAHELRPALLEDFWVGHAEPLEEPSRECVDAVAAQGLNWPVDLSLEIIDIIPPE